MLRSLSVGKWAVKGCSNVIHVIDTHSITFKNRTVRQSFISDLNGQENCDYSEILMSPSTHLVVLKRPKISGFFSSLILSTNTSSGP